MDIEQQLESARQRLLDLSMHNRLLNFRPTKAKTLHITDEIPSEVYDSLVLQEKSLAFRPRREVLDEKVSRDPIETQSPPGSGFGEERVQRLWSLQAAEAGEPIGRYTDRFLQTDLDRETLEKRLFYIISGIAFHSRGAWLFDSVLGAGLPRLEGDHRIYRN